MRYQLHTVGTLLLSNNPRLGQGFICHRALLAENFFHELGPPVDLRLARFVLLEGLPGLLVNLLSLFYRFIAVDSFPLECVSSDLRVKDFVRPVVIVKVRG